MPWPPWGTMRLTEFRVTMYKSVIDSGPVTVEALSVLVGKNESGKTTLLKALHKLNPATPEPYSIEREWPRGRRKDRDPDQVVCTAKFELSDAEVKELAQLTESNTDTKTVRVTRNYRGDLEVQLAEGLFPQALHPNQVDAHCQALPTPPSNSSEGYRIRAEAVRAEAIRLGREGRFDELRGLHPTQTAELQGALSANGQPTYAPETQHMNAYLQGLQQLPAKLDDLPTVQRQAHEFVVTRLPKFIYMSDYRTFQGSALLDQVQARKSSKQSTPEDETFLMILALSGLELETLVTQGKADDRELRQYDLDDGAKTLTETFTKRLKQREYSVQFRADGQQFLTLVTDQTDPSLIRLDERSKGFQWFFSFDLLFMHESGGTFENCVLLLDEPGLHLHPGAQEDLLKRLEVYAQGNTLLYSTHLPFMLDLRHPERIRVINEGDAGPQVIEDLTQTQPDAKLTLQAGLGMRGSQSYLVAQRNIVVEGVDDFMVLTELSQLIWRSGQEGLPDDALVTPAGGASEAAYIATFMIGQKLRVVVLLDTDNAGSDARDKLVKTWLTRYQDTKTQVLSVADAVGVTSDDFAIEDLFSEDFYLERVRHVYSKELTAAGDPNGPQLVGGGQLVKRVERAFDDLGLKFNKGSVAKVIRRDLRAMAQVSELPEPTAGFAVKLIRALTEGLA